MVLFLYLPFIYTLHLPHTLSHSVFSLLLAGALSHLPFAVHSADLTLRSATPHLPYLSLSSHLYLLLSITSRHNLSLSPCTLSFPCASPQSFLRLLSCFACAVHESVCCSDPLPSLSFSTLFLYLSPLSLLLALS